jgi:hypothetical protein
MSKFKYRYRLKDPFKKPESLREPEPPKPPAPVCPHCQGRVKASTEILEGQVVLRCPKCNKLGLKCSLANEWFGADEPDVLNRLLHVAEQERLHREMWGSDISDPRWVQFG